METSHQARAARPAQQKTRIRQLAMWTGAWLLTMALAVPGAQWAFEGDKRLSAIFAVLNFLVGIGMVLANRRFLRTLDELQRKIQLDAMAVALGTGLVVGFSFSVLEAASLVPFDADIGVLAMVMSVAYLAAVIAGTRKYQ